MYPSGRCVCTFPRTGTRRRVHAVLDTGSNVLTGRGTAQRNPADSSAPEIGDDVAAGRPLADLGRQLAVAAA